MMTGMKSCFNFLAHIIGVKETTLKKKSLPGIKKYITHKKEGNTLKFKVKWDKLFKIYKEQAHLIPFDDGGLKGLSKKHSCTIKPTPFHSIHIKKWPHNKR